MTLAISHYTVVPKRKEGFTMALPIAPTPLLRGKDAERFVRTVARDLKHPASYVPTPKLEEARKLVRQYVAESTKK